jgi:hypothetical protein
MSRDLNENAALVVHHGEELDPAVHSAFISLVATQPTRAEVDSAMNKLRSARCPSSHMIQTLAPQLLDYGSTSRWLMAAASVFVCCMCVIASTESWAQVSQDFSNPVNEPRPLSELTELTRNTAVPASEDRFFPRLVLITHITLLTLGLAGMAVTWLISIGSCFLDHWRKSRSKFSTDSTQRRILFSSALLYAVGMILGAVWAQVTWGRLWSWDPRETFGLFTFAFAVIWMRTICRPANSDLDNNRFTAMTASIATIAFGAIVLLFVLGNRYAAALHSHGLPSLTLPNLVFGLVVGFLAVIWTSCALRARLSWNN